MTYLYVVDLEDVADQDVLTSLLALQSIGDSVFTLGSWFSTHTVYTCALVETGPAHWVTSFITSRPVCVYSCSQLRELWFNDLFM